MPEMGSVPKYVEEGARRLDNAMYCLMKGKMREVDEWKRLVSEEVDGLRFVGWKKGEERVGHDPRSMAVLEWVYDSDDTKFKAMEDSVEV